MQLFPILIVVTVMTWDAGLRPVHSAPDLSRGVLWLAVLAAPVLLCLFQGIGVRWCEVRMNRGGGSRQMIAAERLTRWTRWGLVAAHAIAVFGLNWPGVVRGAVGDVVLLDELAAVAPPALGFVATCWVYFPIERRVQEALLIRRLDEGRLLFPPLSRGRFVLQQTRLQLLLLLVPVLLIVGLSEALRLGLGALPDGSVPLWFGDVATASAGLFVFISAPLLAPHILAVRPLAAGELRNRLESVARRHRVRVHQMYEWGTGGTMINAAVMGLFAPLRVVLMTDALLASLNPEQLEAVMAHEIGHVRRHHMFWMVAALLAALAGAAAIVRVPLFLIAFLGGESVLVSESWATTIETIMQGLILIVALVAFAWTSRRFERQADTFAVQHLSGLERGQEGSDVIEAEAVTTFCSALGAISRLNMVDPGRRSWRHGSIRWRQQYLRSLSGRPLKSPAIDRVVRRIKLATVIVFICGMTIEVGLTVLAEHYLPMTDVPAESRGEVV